MCMSKNRLSKILYWDGKAKSFGVYVSKFEAYAKLIGIGDALDSILMVSCPTQLEFVALDDTRPDNQNLIESYKANTKLCTIIALGQGKSQGMALLSKTKSDEYPNGIAWKFAEKAKKPICPLMQVL